MTNFLNALAQGTEIRDQSLANQNALARQQRQDTQQTAEMLAQGVLRSKDPAQAWPQALQTLQRQGQDVSRLPQQWGAEAEMLTRIYAAPEAERTEFERLIKDLDPAAAREAINIKLGRTPDANARLRGQVGDKPTGAMQEYEYAKQQGFPGSFMDWKQSQRGNGVTIGTDENGRPVVQVGGGGNAPMGRSATNEQQKSLADEINLASRLSTLGNLAGLDANRRMTDPSLLTYRGQAENYLTKQAEKLGISVDEASRKALEKRTKFVTGIEQMFNAYRKEITGAAAAVAELERLKKSFINMDMSPTEFEAAYSQYEGELKRSMRVRRRLLREGFNLNSEEGGNMMDRLYLGGGDDNPADRFQELVNTVGEDEAYKQMALEGYI